MEGRNFHGHPACRAWPPFLLVRMGDNAYRKMGSCADIRINAIDGLMPLVGIILFRYLGGNPENG